MSRKRVCATTEQRGKTPEIVVILSLTEQQRNGPINKFIIEAKEKSFITNLEDFAALDKFGRDRSL